MLPKSLVDPLGGQMRRVRSRHTKDLTRDAGYVPVTDAEEHKMPYSARDWRWQFVFGSAAVRRDEAGRGYR